MAEIKLVKKYPHIKDEDVTSIFQEGYLKGFENGRKGTIPIEWIKDWADERCCGDLTVYGQLFYDMLEDWEKEIEI